MSKPRGTPPDAPKRPAPAARTPKPAGPPTAAAKRPAKSVAKPQADGTAPAGERIAKVLARAGIASRRDAEAMIAQGRVQVNGAAITSPALNIGARDRVLVDGKPLPAAERPRLWLYHKPLGIVSTSRDEKGRATVFDNLPPDMPRVMSVGRLDLNSEGLLLLTNDGDLKRRLELPSTGWLRKYRVRVNGTPDEARLAPLRAGITVEGEDFQPMAVTIDRQQGANAWLTIGIREGRNREIRRAMDAVGLVVNRLIRTAYGPFSLGTLEAGAVQELSARALRDQLGLDLPDAPAPKPRPSAPEHPASKPRSGVAGKPAFKPRPGAAGKTGPGTPRSGPRPAQDASARPARRPAGQTEIDAPRPFKSWGSKSRPKAAQDGDTGAPTRARGFLSHKSEGAGGKPTARPAPSGKAGARPGGKPFGGPQGSKPGPKPPRRP